MTNKVFKIVRANELEQKMAYRFGEPLLKDERGYAVNPVNDADVFMYEGNACEFIGIQKSVYGSGMRAIAMNLQLGVCFELKKEIVESCGIKTRGTKNNTCQVML